MNKSFYRYPCRDSSSRFIGPILPFLGGLLIGGIATRPCNGPYCYPPYPPRPMPYYPPYSPYPPMNVSPPPPVYGPYPPQYGVYNTNIEFPQNPYDPSQSFPSN